MRMPKNFTDFRILVARSKFDLKKAEQSMHFMAPMLLWFGCGAILWLYVIVLL